MARIRIGRPPAQGWTSARCSFSTSTASPRPGEISWAALVDSSNSALLRVSRSVPPTELFNQIQDVVPWDELRVQLYRQPKARRFPLRELERVTHRGMIVLFNDGSIVVESEPLVAAATLQIRFPKPAVTGIFLYGRAPVASLGEQDLRPEETPDRSTIDPPDDHCPTAEVQKWEPGALDITFPGCPDSQCPRWMKNTLRRMH